MFWPEQLAFTQSLPETGDLYKASKLKTSTEEIVYEPDPHKDEIIETITNTGNLPYIVITYRSLYMFDAKTSSPIAAHIRSNNSIEEFGKNIRVKRSPNGKQFAIETSKNILLIFTIKSDLSEELLTIFNGEGTIIQNGLPIVSSEVSNGTSNTAGSDNIVKTFINVLLSSNPNEVPVYDFGLRLKLILNIQSPLSDFFFIYNGQLLLVNSKPHAFQLIQLTASGQKRQDIDINETGQHIKFILVDEMEWYTDGDTDPSNNYLFPNSQLDCFVWLNAKGNCWLISNTGDSKNLEFKGKKIYEVVEGSNDDVRVCKCSVNDKKNLIYFALENGDLLIYKLKRDMTIIKLKTIKRHIHSTTLKNIILNPDGDSIVLLYDNGWNVYSCLGNLNFSTYDYDNLEWCKPKELNFINNFEILLTTDHKLFKLNLTNLNHSKALNSVSSKRPVLITKNNLLIFKAYDKNLIDHHHHNDNISLSTNRETNIWFNTNLPLSFKIHNNDIRSCAVSDDGNHVCVVGDYEVLIYNLLTDEWKTLSNEENDQDSHNPVRSCLWWKNHLILGSKTFEEVPKSEVIAFSTKILDRKESFDYNNVIWGFNFGETDQTEDFLSFNIDLFTDELIVVTDELNCYTWKIQYQKYDSKSGQVNDKKSSIKAVNGMSTLLFRRSNVYRLKNCFSSNDTSVISNFRTIIKINEEDLLVLTNSDLVYIKREVVNDKPSYHSYTVSQCVEYLIKLTANLLSVFDGSRILHYDLSSEKNLMSLKPIVIQIGNEIKESSNGFNNSDNANDTDVNIDVDERYIVNSNGTTSYPLTLIHDKNMIFGIEVDYSTTSNLRIESTKKNYLSDLVDYYIRLNLEVDKEDSEALGVTSIYKKFHRFKHFKFVLELLLVSYIQDCYETDNADAGNDYFNTLIELIKMTGQHYSIFLNCLKKIEIHYWAGFFEKYGETPRESLDKIFKTYEDYKLSAHFFIIMLNYEKEENEDNKIDESDLSLINEILLKLVLVRDFETSFELVRFIKIIDDKICNKIITNLETDLKEYSN
ncbi:hypothetical protein CANARDRAFT_17998 [[Candida] arabinofermentans NRRL YB-2248]|uniref:RIC1 C-terminal alpha solenoid region domain-containing protein n=1 Tax=[Candida] arabinofermentans NRRL YB-2248 TaxID=983967 RepID=A0A1E4SZN4_9ASCO|nr:hypothetical protein CANARDRAFT_17998 [[Candida] arabinofermentans NRRL YB-2248]